MSLVHDQTVVEAPRPLPVLRYMSFGVVGTPIGFERAIRNGLAAIAAKVRIKIDEEEALKVYAQAHTNPPHEIRCPDDPGRFYSVMAAHFGHPNTKEQRQFMIERRRAKPPSLTEQ